MTTNINMSVYKSMQHYLNISNGIYEFFNSLKDLSNKDKGDIFEHLSYYVFKEHPLYNNMFKCAYLQQDIPNGLRKELKLPDKDKGIDMLLLDDNDKYYSVQCKYRFDKSTIVPWSEVATFPGLTHACGIKTGIYITNCNDVCEEIKDKDCILNIYGTMFWDTFKYNDN